MNFLARPIFPRFCFADSYLALPTVALALFAALSMLGIERAHGQTVSPSVINGPTIVQHRCSPFSNDYLQFSSSGPVITARGVSHLVVVPLRVGGHGGWRENTPCRVAW
jgi:hypothetical protein